MWILGDSYIKMRIIFGGGGFESSKNFGLHVFWRSDFYWNFFKFLYLEYEIFYLKMKKFYLFKLGEVNADSHLWKRYWVMQKNIDNVVKVNYNSLTYYYFFSLFFLSTTMMCAFEQAFYCGVARNFSLLIRSLEFEHIIW